MPLHQKVGTVARCDIIIGPHAALNESVQTHEFKELLMGEDTAEAGTHDVSHSSRGLVSML